MPNSPLSDDLLPEIYVIYYFLVFMTVFSRQKTKNFRIPKKNNIYFWISQYLCGVSFAILIEFVPGFFLGSYHMMEEEVINRLSKFRIREEEKGGVVLEQEDVKFCKEKCEKSLI